MPRYIGATHAKEIFFVFDDGARDDYDVWPLLGKPQSYQDLASTMATAWASFVATGDPNIGGSGTHFLSTIMSSQRLIWANLVNGTNWPLYTKAAAQNFVFDANVANYIEDDDIRQSGIELLLGLF